MPSRFINDLADVLRSIAECKQAQSRYFGPIVDPILDHESNQRSEHPRLYRPVKSCCCDSSRVNPDFPRLKKKSSSLVAGARYIPNLDTLCIPFRSELIRCAA